MAALQVEKVTLISSDNEQFEVERAVAERSGLISSLLADTGSTDAPIPLLQVSSNILQKILEWCEHHKNDPKQPTEEIDESRKRSTEINEWDQKFLAVDQEMMFELILASNYLDIKPLLDAGCKTIANLIKGKQPEEIRKTFNIKNDFTPEEEAQIRKENEWAEDR